MSSKMDWIPPSWFLRQRSRNSSVSVTNGLFAICNFLTSASQVLFQGFVQKLLLACGNKEEGTWCKLWHYGLKCNLRECSQINKRQHTISQWYQKIPSFLPLYLNVVVYDQLLLGLQNSLNFRIGLDQWFSRVRLWASAMSKAFSKRQECSGRKCCPMFCFYPYQLLFSKNPADKGSVLTLNYVHALNFKWTAKLIPCTEQLLLPKSEQKIWRLFAPLKRHLSKQLTRHSASLKSSHREGPGFWNSFFQSSLVLL